MSTTNTDVLDYTEDDDFDEDADQSLSKLKDKARRRKGRGFASDNLRTTTDDSVGDEYSTGGPEEYDSVLASSIANETDEEFLAATAPGAPQRSVEGWIIFVRNIHEEANEEDIQDKFSEFGQIMNLHLNIDRRTGYLKGYALVEYQSIREAQRAIEGMNEAKLHGQVLEVGWAFVKPKPFSYPSARKAGKKHSASGSYKDHPARSSRKHYDSSSKSKKRNRSRSK